MVSAPKVSIIIPVYNGANYMQNAIDSALKQTYRNIEVIVVNDGSTDNGETERIALSYGDEIRYFAKPNGGVATALNLGIQKMRGEYFSWLSHDDMYAPNKVEEEVRLVLTLTQSDPTVIIAEGYWIMNAAGQPLYKVNLHNQYPSDKLNIPLFLVLRGGVNGCALLIHKSHFMRAGLFDPTLATTQDYDLWFRMFRGQRVYYASTTNVFSRCHVEQGSKTMRNSHSQECDKLWIKMTDAMTTAEMIEISGSVLQFYRELWEFLLATDYHEAAEHAYSLLLNSSSNREKPAIRTAKFMYKIQRLYKPLLLGKKAFMIGRNEGISSLYKRIEKKWRLRHGTVVAKK